MEPVNESWAHKLPSTDLDVDPHHFHEFFRTMYERQRIYVKRNVWKEKAPWTKDKYLRSYNFTNVYRELDRNSEWEIQNIISNLDLSRKELIWQICLFRLFNQPELFDFIGRVGKFGGRKLPSYDEYDPAVMLELVSRFRRMGQNPFTSAYYVNSTFANGKEKDVAFTHDAALGLHDRMNAIMRVIVTAGTKPKDLIVELERIPGVGPFMSHEFYISLSYAAKYWRQPIMRWGQDDYTNVGPGASLGLRLVFPSLNTTGKQLEGIYLLRDLASDYIHEHFNDFDFLKWDSSRRARYFAKHGCNLTLHQIEMWLCEYSKYWKMVEGIGKQRSRFVPKAESTVQL